MAQNTAVSSKLKAPASLPPSLPTPRKEPPSLRKGVGVLHGALHSCASEQDLLARRPLVLKGIVVCQADFSSLDADARSMRAFVENDKAIVKMNARRSSSKIVRVGAQVGAMVWSV